MARTDVLLGLVPYRTKPVPLSDGVVAGTYARASRYGDLSVQSLVPTKHLLADEGSYFTAGNATPGTGIALSAAVTAFADTTGFFVIRNTAPVGGVRMYLDCLKLILTAATTAVQSVDFEVKTDTIVRSPSTVANGTTLTNVNTNQDDGTASQAVVIAYNNAGAMTIPASSAFARQVARGHAATGLHFAGDSIILQFGASERSSTPGLTAVRASGPSQTVCDVAPVIIGPQQTAVIYRWSLTEAAAVTYEYELAWWER